MLLPVMGFFFMLIVVGGLGSLVASADPTRASTLPFTLAMLFTGLGVCILPLGLGALGENLFGSGILSTLMLLIGLVLGGPGGAILGYNLGRRRNERISNMQTDEEAGRAREGQ